ncbi:MAG: signal peptidase I [Flavobacteriia bacterium]
MNVLYFYLFLLVHPYLAMWWKSFRQAGHSSWEGLVPVYNYYVAFKLGCKKPFWSLLLIFPGVHLVMWSVANTSYIRRFGYYSLADTAQGIFFPYLIMAKIANSKNDILPETNWANSVETEKRKLGDHLALLLTLPVIGHAIALAFDAITRAKPGAKSKVKEWGDSLMFAIIAASIIRTYVFEPFQIPTGSMEKTLLVGDFLFVNKLAYGPKVPVTPLSFPLVHNNVPWVNIRSYSTLETSKYTRMPGIGKINRYDVVVFNYPSGDTAVFDPRMPDGLMGHDYHGIVINEAFYLYQSDPETGRQYQIAKQFYADSLSKKNADVALADSLANLFLNKKMIEQLDAYKNKARKMLAEEKVAHQNGALISHFGLIYRPVDKRENYIKRCVGLPGDWLEIKQSVLFVNGKPAFVPEFQNLQYTVTNFTAPSEVSMREKFGLEASRNDYYTQDRGKTYTMNLTKKELNALKAANPDAIFTLTLYPQYSDVKGYQATAIDQLNNLSHFPKDLNVNNTITDFTRFRIPKKGQTIKINRDNIAWYRRIIEAYEGHKLEEKKDGIYIDKKKVTTYTFSMNYYWLMGDNRYNSADSRVWGFVPEDHIVGKASMVWFSKSADPNIGIRWERLFKLIE